MKSNNHSLAVFFSHYAKPFESFKLNNENLSLSRQCRNVSVTLKRICKNKTWRFNMAVVLLGSFKFCQLFWVVGRKIVHHSTLLIPHNGWLQKEPNNRFFNTSNSSKLPDYHPLTPFSAIFEMLWLNCMNSLYKYSVMKAYIAYCSTFSCLRIVNSTMKSPYLENSVT